MVLYVLTQWFSKFLLKELAEGSVFWINPSDQLVHVHRYGDCVVTLLSACKRTEELFDLSARYSSLGLEIRFSSNVWPDHILHTFNHSVNIVHVDTQFSAMPFN